MGPTCPWPFDSRATSAFLFRSSRVRFYCNRFDGVLDGQSITRKSFGLNRRENGRLCGFCLFPFLSACSSVSQIGGGRSIAWKGVPNSPRFPTTNGGSLPRCPRRPQRTHVRKSTTMPRERFVLPSRPLIVNRLPPPPFFFCLRQCKERRSSRIPCAIFPHSPARAPNPHTNSPLLFALFAENVRRCALQWRNPRFFLLVRGGLFQAGRRRALDRRRTGA